jgi:hypothetical protein
MRNLHFSETKQLNSKKKVAIDTIREVKKIKYPKNPHPVRAGFR